MRNATRSQCSLCRQRPVVDGTNFCTECANLFGKGPQEDGGLAAARKQAMPVHERIAERIEAVATDRREASSQQDNIADAVEMGHEAIGLEEAADIVRGLGRQRREDEDGQDRRNKGEERERPADARGHGNAAGGAAAGGASRPGPLHPWPAAVDDGLGSSSPPLKDCALLFTVPVSQMAEACEQAAQVSMELDDGVETERCARWREAARALRAAAAFEADVHRRLQEGDGHG